MVGNTVAPTVSGPTVQLQGVNPNGSMNLVAKIEELPKVSSTAEAKFYPSKAGTQDVLLDVNDNSIAYFRQIDVNGNVFVDRRRCLSEPELTQEQRNDMKYVSKEEFKDLMNEIKSLREELSNNVREFDSATNGQSNATKSNAGSSNKYSENKRN